MRIRRIASTVLCVVLVAGAVVFAPAMPVAGAAASPWVWRNPLPNGTTLYGVDMVTDQIGYAVGLAGLVMKTLDGGQSWQLLVSGTTSDLNDVCFVDASHGWVVGDANTMLYTENGGTSWTTPTMAAGPASDLMGIDMVSSTSGYVVGSNGWIMSTANGTSWDDVSLSSMWNLEDVSVVSGSQAWIVGNDGSQPIILVTSDSGANWNPQTPGTTQYLYGVDFVDATHGWAVGNQGVTLNTIDGGANWNLVVYTYSSSFPGLTDVSFADSQNGWAVGTLWSAGIILGTTDGGATWLRQITPNNQPLNAVSTTGSTTSLAVGNAGIVWRTVDGAAWTRPRELGGVSAITQENLQDIQFRGESRGYAIGGGGVALTTTDGGVTWAKHATGEIGNLFGVYFSDDTHGWAVGTSGHIYASTDGGSNWTPQVSPTTGVLRDVWFSSATEGWAVGSGGWILHTADGGTTWVRQDAAATGEDLYDVRFASPTLGWAVGTGGTVLKTTDGGIDWVASQPAVMGGSALSGIFVLDATHVWVCSGNSKVYFTADGGTNWTQQNAGIRGLNAIAFADANNGWVVGDFGSTCKTTDGGATWVEQTSPTALFPINNSFRGLAVVGSTKAWACGYGGMILLHDTAVPVITTNVSEGGLYRSLNLTYAAGVDSSSATLDGIPFGSGTPVTANGPHTLVVTSTDLAGNTSTLTVHFTFDSIPPVITVGGVSEGGTYPAAGAAPTFSAGGDSCTATLDGAVFTSGTLVKAVGSHTLVVNAVDTAGNAASKTVHFTIAAPVVPTPVYRFYNFTNNTHFFTDSAAERDMVIATWPDVFRFDGQTYSVCPSPAPGATPVYRFYNVRNGSHFYTADPGERDAVIANYPTVYSFEGPAFWIAQ